MRIYSINAVAKKLGVTRQRVHQLIKEGKLEANYLHGRAVYITHAALNKYLLDKHFTGKTKKETKKSN